MSDVPEASLSERHVVIVGAGYLGLTVARFLVTCGARVTGTTRGADASPLTAIGAEHRQLDLAHSGPELDDADAIVCCVAPRDGDQQQAFHDGPLALAGATTVPLVVVSSTSVYAADDGAWVDETSPTIGLLATTERTLFARPKTAIIRSGGLYGFGRSPIDWLRDPVRRERLRRGNPYSWMSWVRVEDVASAIVAALTLSAEGPFNIAHAPVTRGEMYGYAAELAGVEPLTFAAGEGYGKRCATVRAGSVLRWRATYPTYRDGLASVAASAVVE